MKLHRKQLEQAAKHGLISAQQVDSLWQFLAETEQAAPQFHAAHILYYLGGLIAIGAMSLFMTLGWELMGGWGMFFTSLAYACFGLWMTEHLRKQQQLAIPASLCAVFVVVLIPLLVYGLQTALGWWPLGVYRDFHTHVNTHWLGMELATLLGGGLLLWRYRFPLLVLPLALTLCYMSVDLLPLWLGKTHVSWQVRQWVALWFGIGLLVLACVVDVRLRRTQDYAFWLYVVGTLSFWLSLSFMSIDNERSRILYFGINLGMLFLSVVLSRRIFALCGALGVSAYLGHLAYDVFADSLLFPLMLTLIGFGVVYLGILWQRHQIGLSRFLHAWLPQPLRKWLARDDHLS